MTLTPQQRLERFQTAAERAQHAKKQRAKLGWYDGSTWQFQAAGMPTGYVYVRMGAQGNGTVTAVDGNGVQWEPDLDVWVGPDVEGTPCVLGVVRTAARAIYGAYASSVQIPDHQHPFEIVGARRLAPGRLTPVADRLSVTIAEFWYVHAGALVRFPETTVDLSSEEPAGTNDYVYVVVGVDPATNTATYVTGSEYSAFVTPTDDQMDGIDLGGMIPAGAVILRGGAPQFFTALLPKDDDFRDVSPWRSGLPPESGAGINVGICNGRLSLSSTDPVGGGADATTIYFHPYQGNEIALYDGSEWALHTLSSALSLAPSLSSNAVYDVFVYDNGGSPALEVASWGSTTTRSSFSLTTQDGVYVKSGATTRRYVGTFITDASSKMQHGIQNTVALWMGVWNYYNRIRQRVVLYAANSATSWTYGTQTWHAANADLANRVRLAVGLQEEVAHLRLCIAVESTDAVMVGAGLATASNTIDAACMGYAVPVAAGGTTIVNSALVIRPGIGLRDIYWTEYGGGTGTQTFNASYYSAPYGNFGVSGDWTC